MVTNFLEEAMKSLFETEGHAILVHVHKYEQQRCLLSDRGFSSPIEQGAHLAFDFNLCATALIRFAFLDYKTVLGRDMPESIRRGLKRGPKLVHVTYQTNDLLALDVFHRRVIEQSYEKVYCSGKAAYSANVLPPAVGHRTGQRCTPMRPWDEPRYPASSPETVVRDPARPKIDSVQTGEPPMPVIVSSPSSRAIRYLKRIRRLSPLKTYPVWESVCR
jgi:hypothetical protein